MNLRLRYIPGFFLFILFACNAIAAESWPEFRGPTGQGHAGAAKLPTEWSETKNVEWKTELPGKGWSSPVAADGVIWLTAAIDTPLNEEQKKEKLKKNTGDQPLNAAGHVDLFVLGIDQQTGKLLHQVKVLGVDEPQWIHTLNSYASPTPVLSEVNFTATLARSAMFASTPSPCKMFGPTTNCKSCMKTDRAARLCSGRVNDLSL